jgi:nucleotide-binding universal stress UspA family protein
MCLRPPPMLLYRQSCWAKRRSVAEQEAHSQMARLQHRRCGFTGLDWEALLREGDPASSLLRLVSVYSIDLLIVATRGYSHLKRLLMGSVAEKLFRQAFCRVLIIPAQARMSSDQSYAIHHIVCPIDFSAGSSAALACAILLARDHEAQLIVVHVVKGAVLNSTEDMHRLTKSVKDRLRLLLPARLDLLFSPRFEVAFGPPAEGISRIASQYQSDLVVVAVHSADPTQAHQYERIAYRVIR